jgi:hypothetical protein
MNNLFGSVPNSLIFVTQKTDKAKAKEEKCGSYFFINNIRYHDTNIQRL